MQHTTRPLHAEGNLIMDAEQRIVGSAFSTWIERPEREANARLWAGAADLFAACKDMLEKIARHYPNDWTGTQMTARQAIAKVEGKQP